MKKTTREEAVQAIATVLASVGKADMEYLCAEAIALAQRARAARRLRQDYRRLAEPGETWEAFLAEAIEVGEWNPEWGSPSASATE